jgi:uroporphyrinogen-III synthase
MPRKKTMIRVTVTLRQEDLDEVDQLADKLTIPRSAAVRILLMEALEQREPQKMTIQVEQREPDEPQHVAMAIEVEKPEPPKPE